MSFSWGLAQPFQTPQSSTATLPGLSLAAPPVPAASSLPSPPHQNPLPPAPQATDAHSTRIALTLSYLKTEMRGVKQALDEVLELGKAVEALQDEVKDLRVLLDKRDEALEQRVQSAVHDLLASHLSPLADELDSTRTAIVETVATAAATAKEQVRSAQGVAEEAQRRAEKVEGVMNKRSSEATSKQQELDSKLAALETRLGEVDKNMSEASEAAQAQVASLEEQVQQVERELEQAKSVQNLASTPQALASPLPPPTTALHSTVAPAGEQNAPSSEPVQGSSPPPRRRTRQSTSATASRALSGNEPQLSTASVPTASQATAPFADEPLALFSNPSPAPLPSFATTTTLVPALAPSSSTKRRLISQDELDDADEPAHGADALDRFFSGSHLSTATSEPLAPRRKRRLIEQDHVAEYSEEDYAVETAGSESEKVIEDGAVDEGAGGGEADGAGEEPDTQE
ncbi:hypothetical protein JCM10207_008803 [Rhodosporidiobolus poonsookiae]